jgi:hypothetical protein
MRIMWSTAAGKVRIMLSLCQSRSQIRVLFAIAVLGRGPRWQAKGVSSRRQNGRHLAREPLHVKNFSDLAVHFLNEGRICKRLERSCCGQRRQALTMVSAEPPAPPIATPTVSSRGRPHQNRSRTTAPSRAGCSLRSPRRSEPGTTAFGLFATIWRSSSSLRRPCWPDQPSTPSNEIFCSAYRISTTTRFLTLAGPIS